MASISMATEEPGSIDTSLGVIVLVTAEEVRVLPICDQHPRSAGGNQTPHTDYCRLFPDCADPGVGAYR